MGTDALSQQITRLLGTDDWVILHSGHTLVTDEDIDALELASVEPAASAQVVDERDPACVEAWPECETFGYDPRCCRFPKSCSAGQVRLVTDDEPTDD